MQTVTPTYEMFFKRKVSQDALPNGNIPEYACGPLTRPRYINPKIEQELIEFKVEIEEKWEASAINHTYVFPRTKSNLSQQSMEAT